MSALNTEVATLPPVEPPIVTAKLDTPKSTLSDDSLMNSVSASKINVVGSAESTQSALLNSTAPKSKEKSKDPISIRSIKRNHPEAFQQESISSHTQHWLTAKAHHLQREFRQAGLHKHPECAQEQMAIAKRLETRCYTIDQARNLQRQAILAELEAELEFIHSTFLEGKKQLRNAMLDSLLESEMRVKDWLRSIDNNIVKRRKFHSGKDILEHTPLHMGDIDSPALDADWETIRYRATENSPQRDAKSRVYLGQYGLLQGLRRCPGYYQEMAPASKPEC
ncbi:hypothetical protein IWQ61_008169 [Dispira simplex]|nr:hypothetical protein IWQ61_008169 [Dispira simplex]